MAARVHGAVFVHCLWVWKGRTDLSERVHRLGRGPCHQKCVGFGVSQADRLPRFRPNDWVLRGEMRQPHVFMDGLVATLAGTR